MVEVQRKDSFEYLQGLESIRERCQQVYEHVKAGKSECFELHQHKLKEASDYIVKLIERDYGPFEKATLTKIPPHGRWLHFGGDRLEKLIETVGEKDALPAILDLFVVAVLLDAGAGEAWKYVDSLTGETFTRSEGLAVAAYYMFTKGLFSSDPANPYQVDSDGLAAFTLPEFAVGMQVTEDNPVVGLEGRFNLLKKLGEVLKGSEYFVGDQCRPSNFMTFLSGSADGKVIDIKPLWEVVTKGFGAVWPPAGAKVDGKALGDAWTLKLNGSKLVVPFHKLSQWLTYSLMVPITKLSPYRFANTQIMTGLPEYRNGGLFVDLGILTLKEKARESGLTRPESKEGVPTFHVYEQVIIEWRALIICLLDEIAEDLRARLGTSPDELTLPMILEAGSWKAGRELAAKLRPATKNPPISIISDGTVF